MAEGMTFREAVLEALFEEMRANPSVMLMGEDVGVAGGVFRQTAGLFEAFGPTRVIDTPISEAGAFGMAVGAAMAGMRPVFEVMFGDFMTLCMDQLVNQAAKIRYMSNGTARAPLVLRTTMGVGAGTGPQHSQGFHGWAAQVPGLKVVLPSNAQDAKILMKAAIRDDDPVLFFEDRVLYTSRGGPASPDPTLGRAQMTRPGRDATVVALGRMVSLAQAAASELARDGIEVEIIDPRSLVPLDVDAILASVRRTHRALVIDAAPLQFGVTGEIASLISEQAFDWLDAPVGRLGAVNAPVPISRTLEPLVLPSPTIIADKIRALLA